MRRLALFFFTFRDRRRSLPDIDGDHYGIDYIVKYVQQYRPLVIRLPPFGPVDEHALDFEIDPVTERFAKMFKNWMTVYDATKAVAKSIREGQNVNMYLLMKLIPPVFTRFVTEGLKQLD
jgi:hypothetical protein